MQKNLSTEFSSQQISRLGETALLALLSMGHLIPEFDNSPTGEKNRKIFHVLIISCHNNFDKNFFKQEYLKLSTIN